MVEIRPLSCADFAELLSVEDAACILYSRFGIELQLSAEHPFVVDERTRWLRSTSVGRTFGGYVAGELAGICVLDVLDDAPYLDQLAVHPAHMRRGLGRALVRHAVDWAERRADRELWLTTYGHLPFNRPFYETEGFIAAAEQDWSPGIQHHIEEQRRWLPLPEQRVAMRKRLKG